MSTQQISSQWASGDAYQRYMGRWSRILADRFLEWLAPQPGGHWLDVGSGAGALTEAILASAEPASILGIDQSAPFVAFASQRLTDPRIRFETGDAQTIAVDDDAVDYAVSGLCINFVPDPARAAGEMTRVTRSDGSIAVYVWDYKDGMQMLRYFWDAARQNDPDLTVDEAHTNSLCAPEPLKKLFEDAGLTQIETTGLEIDQEYRDFDDYWLPFGDGTGPAPAYLRRLPVHKQQAIEETLRRQLPIAADGSIRIGARAWAVKGRRS